MSEADKIDKANFLLSNLLSPERSAELRKLYRKLAKELHPDVNQNLTEQQKNLWHAVRRAYESGDLESMRALSVMANDSLTDLDKWFFGKVQKKSWEGSWLKIDIEIYLKD